MWPEILAGIAGLIGLGWLVRLERGQRRQREMANKQGRGLDGAWSRIVLVERRVDALNQELRGDWDDSRHRTRVMTRDELARKLTDPEP